MIYVQQQDFSVSQAYERLRASSKAGAVVFFVGLVRDLNLGETVTGLYLEHYPGMTERYLKDIVAQAQQRWPILDVELIHRVGPLAINEQIVFVGVSAAHREDAYLASQFIMDYLKTQAPFWKKELTHNGAQWLEPRESDYIAARAWSK